MRSPLPRWSWSPGRSQEGPVGVMVRGGHQSRPGDVMVVTCVMVLSSVISMLAHVMLCSGGVLLTNVGHSA